MPLSPFPLPGADLFNAGNALRDRGRYLRSGGFTWLPSGNNGFTGTVVGYAQYTGNDDVVERFETAGGSIGIDGSTAMRCNGGGAIAVNRWATGSVQVNGGIAWGVTQPAGGAIPSYYEMTRALDRMHKDGSWAVVNHDFDYTPTGSPNLGFLGGGTVVLNQAGPGILLNANLAQKMNTWSSGQSMASALDVTVDGTYRFSLVNGIRQEYAQSNNANGWQAANASFGFIPFASNVTVRLRRGSDNGQRIEASMHFVTGA